MTLLHYIRGSITDLFNLQTISVSDAKEYYKLILGTTSSIFGVMIAVLIFSFELLGKNSQRRDKLTKLNDHRVVLFISIAVMIILLSLFAFLRLTDLTQDGNLNIAYYLSYLFISFIIFLFPVIQLLLKSTITIIHVNNNIDRIDTINEFNKIQYIIEDDFIDYIQNSDYKSYKEVLINLNKKGTVFFKIDSIDFVYNSVFYSLFNIWRKGRIEAKRINDPQYNDAICNCIYKLYEYAFQNDIPLYKYSPLYYFLNEYINDLKDDRNILALQSVCNATANSFLHYLKNPQLSEENINSVYNLFEQSDAPNHKEEIQKQWDHILKILNVNKKLLLISTEVGSQSLFEACLLEQRNILFSIPQEMGNYLKANIRYEIYYYNLLYGTEALEKNLFPFVYSVSVFNPEDISNLINEKEIYSNIFLDKFLQQVSIAQRFERLDSLTIEKIDYITKRIVPNFIENEMIEVALRNIVRWIKRIQIQIQIDPDYINSTNYKLTIRVLTNLEKRLIEAEKIKPEIIQSIMNENFSS